MICPECGTEVEERKWFCPKCSFPLHADEDILPEDFDREPEGEPAPPQEESTGSQAEDASPQYKGLGIIYRGRIRKSWLIRILVTVLIIALLILALILIARSREARGFEIRVRRLEEEADAEAKDMNGSGGPPGSRLYSSRKAARPSSRAMSVIPKAMSPLNCFARTYIVKPWTFIDQRVAVSETFRLHLFIVGFSPLYQS